MSYFRKVDPARHWFSMVGKEQKWLILINADPDAMASSMALRRILRHHGATVDIAGINEVHRPDNLAMIRYTRMEMRRFSPGMAAAYSHLALVDSQPSHNPQFEDLEFSAIIDHHPPATPPEEAEFMEIKPEYGATSTILTEYLYNLNLRIGARLATALQFGIRTDTGNFQRHTCEVDLRAYQYLSKFADPQLLTRIVQSELRLDWLPYVARAISRRRKIGSGHLTVLDKVDSPDILVLIADFLTRVYEIRWLIVAGIHEKNIVLIFRGDGLTMDMGRLAQSRFDELGSAGGHKAMARAEFPLETMEGGSLDAFIRKRLQGGF
ncbi:MAG: DHH family phosphoesterase [Deltaproteobacteria bacterium]|jgi:nanoRNase/pAp phosphatase (c-di-AMP/oligoRNAs hydrolase)|nr:DHH family phosphoesterase [Deltaproteobacteria bacterium]